MRYWGGGAGESQTLEKYKKFNIIFSPGFFVLLKTPEEKVKSRMYLKKIIYRRLNK